MLKVFFSLLFINIVVLCTTAIELEFQDQIAEGETYYVELKRKAQSYGECWKEAMSDLHTGCKQLTEDVQSRLALAFANCFLTHTGVGPCLCSDDVLISDCLSNCSDRVYSTFTEFFTHTQSVCHFLQHREWQVEMAKTALLLTENSKKISKTLDESARSQFKLLDLQKATLDEQRRSISNGKILTAELMRSRESARDLYNEFKTTTYEQKLLLFEIFDRMSNLQNFVLGEFTGVYTAVYYLVVAILVYILTSVPRTADARIWLILIISLNAAAEKFLTSYTLQRNSIEVNPITTSELLYQRIWLCRKTVCLICVVSLIITYYRYKDYNAINNELLREIQRQNIEIQNFVKGLTCRETFSPALKTSTNEPLLYGDGKMMFNNIAEKNHLPKQSTPIASFQQERALKNNNMENKENNFFTAVNLAASPVNPVSVTSPITIQKVMPKRKTTVVKKNSQVKNQESTIKSPLKGGSILSNQESPISPSDSRYNLRRSSRLKSPLSPP